MIIKEWQAKKLYINKAQLEKALGISLDELPTKSFSYNEPLADYLIPYSSMEYFDIEDCVALLVGVLMILQKCTRQTQEDHRKVIHCVF